jgi:mono/diheme cytochrome c family protein
MSRSNLVRIAVVVIIVFAVLVIVRLHGAGGQPADTSNGFRLAERWCASCHLIGRNPGQVASDEAPPFASVAKRPGFDAGRLALFLLDPHPKMPDMGLSRSNAADLAAYIGSLDN